MIEVNLLAVLIATVASYAVGALWYGFLFQKKWMELMGITPESMKATKLTPAMSMTIGFFTTLLMVYVLAHFAVMAGVMNIVGALQLGFWVWLGLQLPIIAHQVLYENRPFMLFLINLAHQFVAVMVAAIVLSLF